MNQFPQVPISSLSSLDDSSICWGLNIDLQSPCKLSPKSFFKAIRTQSAFEGSSQLEIGHFLNEGLSNVPSFSYLYFTLHLFDIS